MFFLIFQMFVCLFAYCIISWDFQQITIEKQLGIISIVSLIGYSIFLKRSKLNIFTVGNIFIVFLYLMNLGLPIARLCGWINTEDAIRFMDRRIYSMGCEIFNRFIVYAICIISFIELGYTYFCLNDKNNKCIHYRYIDSYDDGSNFEKKLKHIHLGGIILVILGFVPYIYLEYYYILGSLIYGYQNVDNPYISSGNGIGLLSNLMTIGLIMLAISFQKQKRAFDLLFFFVVSYHLIRMYLTGDRSTGLMIIFVWALMRHKYINPIKGKKIIPMIGLTYIAMMFLKTIEMTRSLGGMDVYEAISKLSDSNILGETVFEYGGNVWSGLMVMYSVPTTSSFRFGLTYFAAVIGKPFKILGITDKIWKYADFSNFLMQEERGPLINSLTAAMGGSFIGELWFNFGWVAIVIASFFGIFLGWLSMACFDSDSDPFLSSYLLYISTLLLWWTRQYFTSVAWDALVYGAVLLLLKPLVKLIEIKLLVYFDYKSNQ